MGAFSLSNCFIILEKTVPTIESIVGGLPSELVETNEGGDSWSCYDILGHLIHGEKTDWIPRLNIMLNEEDKHFEPFDRFAQERDSIGKTFVELLAEFKRLRTANIQKLKGFKLSPEDFGKEGIHPEFGAVTVQNLLSAWTAHDLGHIYQISRVIAKQFQDGCGPWPKYLRILND